ncbi:MAG: hypothetical protein ABIB97_05385 [Patescibacteria group bacterium]
MKYLTDKQRDKALRKVSFRKQINKNLPVYNPVKENLKAGWRFVRLFWALIVLAIIFFVIVRYGEQWGIRLDW